MWETALQETALLETEMVPLKEEADPMGKELGRVLLELESVLL
jgi:hypothetical protein